MKMLEKGPTAISSAQLWHRITLRGGRLHACDTPSNTNPKYAPQLAMPDAIAGPWPDRE